MKVAVVVFAMSRYSYSMVRAQRQEYNSSNSIKFNLEIGDYYSDRVLVIASSGY